MDVRDSFAKGANTIKSLQAFRRVLPYQQMVEEKWFPRGGRPQDIDGELELNGHFLYQEWMEVGRKTEGPRWAAASKRLFLLNQHAWQLYIYYDKPKDKDQVATNEVRAVRVARRDKWLESQRDSVKLTKEIPCTWSMLGNLNRQWVLHTEGKPNYLTEAFRKSGPYIEADMQTKYNECESF